MTEDERTTRMQQLIEQIRKLPRWMVYDDEYASAAFDSVGDSEREWHIASGPDRTQWVKWSDIESALLTAGLPPAPEKEK